MTSTDAPHPFADLLGISVTKAAAGEASGELTLEEKLLNPHGVAHGGVVYALADTVMGGALRSKLSEEQSCATLEIKITYFRPAFDGRLICSASVDHCGKRIGHISARIEGGGKLIALATGNFVILPAPPEKR